MASSRLCLLLLSLLVVSAASQPGQLIVVGSPTPVIKEADTQQQQQQQSQTNSANQIISSKAHDEPAQSNALGSAGALAAHSQQAAKINVADKLKQGLTNFVNQLNPASFFVPNSAQFGGRGPKQAAAASAASKPTSTREPPTIINDGPSADAIIKGPNRLVRSRPLGGPLRWG